MPETTPTLTDEQRDQLRDWWDSETEGDSTSSMLANLDATVARMVADAYQRGYDDGCDDPESVWTSTIAAVEAGERERIAAAIEAMRETVAQHYGHTPEEDATLEAYGHAARIARTTEAGSNA